MGKEKYVFFCGTLDPYTGTPFSKKRRPHPRKLGGGTPTSHSTPNPTSPFQKLKLKKCGEV